MADNIVRGYFDRPLPTSSEDDNRLDIGLSFDNLLRTAIRSHAKILGIDHTEFIVEQELLTLMQSDRPEAG